MFFICLLYPFSSEEVRTTTFILQFEKKSLGFFCLVWIAAILIVWKFFFMVWVFKGCFCFVWRLGLVLGIFFPFCEKRKKSRTSEIIFGSTQLTTPVNFQSLIYLLIIFFLPTVLFMSIFSTSELTLSPCLTLLVMSLHWPDCWAAEGNSSFTEKETNTASASPEGTRLFCD